MLDSQKAGRHKKCRKEKFPSSTFNNQCMKKTLIDLSLQTFITSKTVYPKFYFFLIPKRRGVFGCKTSFGKRAMKLTGPSVGLRCWNVPSFSIGDSFPGHLLCAPGLPLPRAGWPLRGLGGAGGIQPA